MSDSFIRQLKTTEVRALLNDAGSRLVDVFFVPFENDRRIDDDKESYRLVLRVDIHGIETDITIKTENRKQRIFRSIVRAIDYVRTNFECERIIVLNKIENSFNPRFIK